MKVASLKFGVVNNVKYFWPNSLDSLQTICSDLAGELLTPKIMRAELLNFKSSVEKINVLLIDEYLLNETIAWVSGCESCADNAVIPFDYLLDVVTNCDPRFTEHLMCRPAKCPRCCSEIREKTHVRLRR